MPPPSCPAGFPWQPSSLGRKLEPGATGFLPKRPLAGGQRSLAALDGGTQERRQVSALAGGAGTTHCSAGAQCRAALGTVAHQALVGFEACQGLAAGDGGQGAAEAQHGGRGVLPWGERAGEARPINLPGSGLGIRLPPTGRRLISAAFAVSVNLVQHLPVPCTAQGTRV